MSDFESIRQRDRASAPMWFYGPASFTAQAARDRRTLLTRLEDAFHECNVLRAKVEALQAAIKRHNDGCQARCGYGDQEAVRCGWRPYFEGSGRRCPTCPTYNVIEIDGAAGQPPEGQKP